MSATNTQGTLSPNNLWPCTYVFPSVEERTMHHPIVFCVALDPICCSLQQYNKMNKTSSQCVICNIAVIAPVSAGYSKAPFEGKNLPHSQHLSNITIDPDHGRELLLTAFDKHSSNNTEYRGDHRPDVCALVRTGCTLKMLIGKHTFNPKYQPIFEPGTTSISTGDVIRVMLHCGSTHGVSEEEIKGCFIKISKVAKLSNSISSFMSHMKTFPSSFASQKLVTEACSGYSRFPMEEGKKKIPVAGMIFGNGGDCALISDVSRDLVCMRVDIQDIAKEKGYEGSISEDLSIVKVQNVTNLQYSGDKIQELDVETRLLMRYCNCKDVQKCCNLVEIAASLNALNVFAIKKYNFNHDTDKKKLDGLSGYRGVPIIDFQKIMGVFWHNNEMRGLKDFIEHLHKNGFQRSCFKYVCNGEAVLIRYEESLKLITIRHINKHYTVDSESREIIVCINPAIQTDGSAEDALVDATLDNQLVHKSMKISKYCKVSIDLGKPVSTKGGSESLDEPSSGFEVIEVEEDESEIDEEEEGRIRNYLSFKMNLSLSPVDWSFGSKKGDDVLHTFKRKRVTFEDADGSDSN